MNVEASVLKRYSDGAEARQPDLCCPVDYDASLLKLLPQEIIDKDYGCGDPSRYVRDGDTVLDLGSGSGKICYMAAQLVGENGNVIGVDMNDNMLQLARKYQSEMAERIGSDRVRFLKGQIQDLCLNLDQVNTYLHNHPVTNTEDMLAFRAWQQKQRSEHPLIKDNSVDLVVSNCVLNLVQDSDKKQLIQEIFRVTKPGGRIAISDIISDEAVPIAMKNDPELWSGCISGALQEHEFLQAFIDAGFIAVAYDKWEAEPWQVVEDIEFRSATVTAVKPKSQECMDKGHAVIYKGPFEKVYDDEGHVYFRGQRMAVCERTFQLLTGTVYGNDFIGVSPAEELPGNPWCAPAGTIRPAAATKSGQHYNADHEGNCC